MQRVGLFEAKTHLSALVEQARSGQSFVITVRGVPTARLVPITAEAEENPVSFLLSNTVSMGMSIREAIDEGRK